MFHNPPSHGPLGGEIPEALNGVRNAIGFRIMVLPFTSQIWHKIAVKWSKNKVVLVSN